MTHDISRLKARLDSIDKVAGELAGLKFATLLAPIIHRPGWTTPAEFALMEGALESLQRQINNVVDQSRRVLEAAGAVGQG